MLETLMNLLFLKTFKHWPSYYSEKVHVAWKRQRLNFICISWQHLWWMDVGECLPDCSHSTQFLCKYRFIILSLSCHWTEHCHVTQTGNQAIHLTDKLMRICPHTYHGSQQLQQACHIFLILLHCSLFWCSSGCVQNGSLSSCWLWGGC